MFSIDGGRPPDSSKPLIWNFLSLLLFLTQPQIASPKGDPPPSHLAKHFDPNVIPKQNIFGFMFIYDATNIGIKGQWKQVTRGHFIVADERAGADVHIL